MEEDKKKVKILLILLLFSSCVAAFSLGAMTYTFATGEIPFDLQVLEQFKPDEPKPQPKYKTAPMPIEDNAPDELTLRLLHDELQGRTKKLDDREKQINESIEAMNQLVSNSEEVEKRVKDTLAKIKAEKEASLADIKTQEDSLKAKIKAFDADKNLLDQGIVKSIAGTVTLMGREASMIILSDLDVKETARLMRFMTPQKQSEVLETMVSTTELNGKPLNPADQLSFRKKANEIVVELRKLKENIAEDPEPIKEDTP